MRMSLRQGWLTRCTAFVVLSAAVGCVADSSRGSNAELSLLKDGVKSEDSGSPISEQSVCTAVKPITLAEHLAAESDDAETDAVEIIGPATPIPAMPVAAAVPPGDPLAELVRVAIAQNPRLNRLAQEAAAAWARVPQVRALPDPQVGTNVFVNPIETASGSQRSNHSVSQMIPWLKRLDAQGCQAAFEAAALEQVLRAEQLKIAAEVKTVHHRLYVLGRRIEINQTNSELLESLIDVADARIATGTATQADVLLGSLELSRLAEELISLDQQVASAKASLNRLLSRPSDAPVAVPQTLDVSLPGTSLDGLRQLAFERQPEIAAARLRTQASRWGIEVAELRRRPDVTVSFNYFRTDDNRPPSRIVEVGEDPFSFGANVSIPLWTRKYDAIEAEAARRHYAAHAGVEEVVQRYDARLLDLLEQARAAAETVELYENTLLLQARQTLESDQQAYGQGKVEFDRVIQDFRSLLSLEVEYHRAIGRLAIAIAGLEQAAAADLNVPPGPVDDEEPPPPAPSDDEREE